MVALCPTCTASVISHRRHAVQHAAATAARQPFRAAGSAYFGQSLRPHFAKGLPLGSRRSRQLQVQAAIFGVGAPEAVLVGVVALLVFGPKGLAQAAKSLGETLRAFQPTIRELTQVSAELKSTLENEIGINEIKQELQRPAALIQEELRAATATTTAPAQPQPQGSTSLAELADEMTEKVKGVREDMARVVDPDIERKRAESAKMAWGADAATAAAAGTASATAAAEPKVPQIGLASSSAAVPQIGLASSNAAPTAAAAPQQQPPAAAAASTAGGLESLSIEQLEAELRRRKAAAAAQQVPGELRADD